VNTLTNTASTNATQDIKEKMSTAVTLVNNLHTNFKTFMTTSADVNRYGSLETFQKISQLLVRTKPLPTAEAMPT